MRTFRHLLLVVLTLTLAACATHRSPTAKSSEPAFLFVTDDERAVFQAAYDAMLDGRRESPIEDIDGPIRGFTLTQRFALDYWTSSIRVFPATGVTSDGRTVSGYYPEVSGDGSLIIRGPAMDKRIYESALQRMSSVGSRVEVVSLARGEYRFDRDQWRLNASPSPRDGGTISLQGAASMQSRTVTERLRELDALLEGGAISKGEYEDARKKIIEDL